MNISNLIFRSFLVLVFMVIATINKDFIILAANYKIGFIYIYQIIWFIFAIWIVSAIFKKTNNKNIGKPKKSTIKLLKEYKRKINLVAIKVAVFWLFILAIIGILLYYGILSKFSLFIISALFYFGDELCVSKWCFLKELIMKNRCCRVCRIQTWGNFMIVSPLIFILSFWTYSLIFASLIAIIKWEYLHFKYPERFFELCNTSLQCKNCKEKCKTCKKTS